MSFYFSFFSGFFFLFLFLAHLWIGFLSCCFIFRNHTQNHLKLHEAFVYPQIRNTSRMQCTQMLWLHVLSNKKKVAQFNWTNDKEYRTVNAIFTEGLL